MPKGNRKYKSKASNGMAKRVAKLEEQMEPVLKTFEQRQHDYVAPSGTNYTGMPLSYQSPQVFRGSDLYPTLQDGTPASAQNGTIRLGDKITLKSLRMRGEVRACDSAGAAAERTNIVRLILVRFSESVVSLTNAEICSAVLQQYPTITGGTIGSVDAMYSSYKNVIDTNNSLPIMAYKKIYDKTFRLTNPQAPLASGSEQWRAGFSIEKFWKKGLVCQYSKPLSDQPDINQVVLIALSDSNVAPHPDITLVSRAKYMDA